MPLVVESSSCCDICAEEFTCENRGNSPHAIACGHIFCGTCIGSFKPQLCPFCRAPFTTELKLRVDAAGNNLALQQNNLAIDTFLRRIASAYDEASTMHDISNVVTEVNHWVSAHLNEEHRLVIKPLRLALTALCRHQSGVDDLATTRAVENSLRMQLVEEQAAASTLQEQLSSTIRTLRADRDDLRVDLRSERETLALVRQQRAAASALQDQLFTTTNHRDALLADLWSERETVAAVRQELEDVCRELAGQTHDLRSENTRLPSQLSEANINLAEPPQLFSPSQNKSIEFLNNIIDFDEPPSQPLKWQQSNPSFRRPRLISEVDGCVLRGDASTTDMRGVAFLRPLIGVSDFQSLPDEGSSEGSLAPHPPSGPRRLLKMVSSPCFQSSPRSRPSPRGRDLPPPPHNTESRKRKGLFSFSRVPGVDRNDRDPEVSGLRWPPLFR